jgi:error-prone DNA polymerase
VNYAELAITTNYSFLRGASHPREFAVAATLQKHRAIGIADRNTLAGVVRAYDQLKDPKLPKDKPRLLVGARLVFRDGTPDILAYPTDRQAYGRLCRLLSLGKLRTKKGECDLDFGDLFDWQEGLLFIVVPPEKFGAETKSTLELLTQIARGRAWLGAARLYRGNDRKRMGELQHLADTWRVPLIAINDVLYHSAERRELQDVVTCIREHVTLNQAGKRLEINAERHLKPPEEMERLFSEYPRAIEETLRFADRISFTLDQIKYNYPDEPIPPGKTAQEHLEDLTWQGAAMRYPDGLPAEVEKTLRKELALIENRDYAPYFLTVREIVQFANDKSILCQGRGSAANSAVCYVLGITAVDPLQIDLLFERFVSENREEPPDIDVDFEHERREEVIQHIYKRYGHARAALTATVICYRPRSAIREVGKVFGLTEDVTSALASGVWGSWGSMLKEREVRQGNLDPHNLVIARAVMLANELIGFPRHLSQHVGGFVLTRDRLDEIVPIGPAAMDDRYFIEWDKDDLDRLGMMKVDILALGMLTCIRKAFDLFRQHENRPYTLATVPREQPEVYDMLCRADAIGVFQVESRAQMNMLPRLKPRVFYDLVIEVAIVRPGPIQGDMVHPYLRRRSGQEKVVFPAPNPKFGPAGELKQVLGKTLGVPLFQEQAMKLAIVAAEFTPEEANGLRRAMATFRHVGTIDQFREKMVGGMVRRGYEQDFAERCFKQIEGFGSYGFPESHAASFSHLVYISAWIKCHHPAVFACALLNSQPMGFYAPAEIVRDAREHGVDVLPPDINFSQWDNTLERNTCGAIALRLGFRQIDGMGEAQAAEIVNGRGYGYASLDRLVRRTEIFKRTLVTLAEADAFRSLGMDRREALWAVRRVSEVKPLPLFAAAHAPEQTQEARAPLPAMPLSEHVLADYQTLRLSLKAYPMQFLRAKYDADKILSCASAGNVSDGKFVRAAGIVLVRQRPGEGNAVFVTLSDETGILNAVIWLSVFEKYRKEVMGARVLLVEGRIQKSPENVVHLVAERLIDRSDDLRLLADEGPDPAPVEPYVPRHPRNVRVLPKSRDFH